MIEELVKEIEALREQAETDGEFLEVKAFETVLQKINEKWGRQLSLHI
jgi:hypothetical protein